MRIKNILLATVSFFTLVACGGNDYSPKPQAYLRLDTPEHNYWLVDSLCIHPGDTLVSGTDTMIAITGSCKTFPFTFEANTRAELEEKSSPAGETWLDIKYPQWDGVVFLTYHRMSSSADLRGQIDTSSRLLESHYQFASGIDEQAFESDDHMVHAVKWHLKGKNVASTYQFYATDSLHHFLRGAVFINHAPNNDSLAPILEYMHRDVDHLIETLRWK